MKTNRRYFLNQLSTGAAVLGFWPVLTECRSKDQLIEGMIKAIPELEGVSSKSIINFINAANESGLEWHSFALLRRGKVLAETYWKPFEKGMKHTLYSLSKSFTSSAIGFAVQENLLAVEDQVLSFFKDEYKGEPDENLKKMKVKHLLTMNSGHETDTLPVMRSSVGENWVTSFLNHPVIHEPGTHFLYNTGATYMLGAILEKVSGQLLVDYLKPRLFDPLGIKDYDWEKSPDNLNTAGYGLRVSTDSIAKFGQFYLQEGKWEGKQLLNSEWIKTATSKLTESNPGDGDWSQGYGYQFWRCKPGFYRGDGAFGQYCIIMPDQEMVIAVNSETFDMGKSMQLMWDHLLPGISDKVLEEDPNTYAELQTMCENQVLNTPKIKYNSPNAGNTNGVKYIFSENPFNISAITFNITDRNGEMLIESNQTYSTLKFNVEAWKVNEKSLNNPFPATLRANTSIPSLIASSATWIDDTNLQITNKFIECIHSDKIICTFDKDELRLKFNLSSAEYGGWGPDERPELVGNKA